MTEEKMQLYGWFSQKQLEAIIGDKPKSDDDRSILIPTYYIENRNKIICTNISRDPEEHHTMFKDIQLLGKVYQYVGAYRGNLCDIESLNKEALK